MGKSPRIFALRFFICAAALVAVLSTINGFAAPSDDSEELEQLLNEDSDQTEVESEEEYALPVPQSSEAESPVLSEGDPDALSPEGRSTEELFLPVPSDQVGLPGVEGETEEDFLPFTRAGDVRHETADMGYRKPGWTLFAGYAMKSYEVVVPNSMPGVEVGTHIRLLSGELFSLPMSLHAFGAVTFTSLGDIKGTAVFNNAERTVTVPEVQDRTYRVGALLELQLSRRFQLYGGVFKVFSEQEITNRTRKAHYFDANNNNAQVDVSAGPIYDKIDDDRFTPGVGLQWDFYVVPHASLGLRAWAEVRYITVLLTFSAEPVPRNRNSLNFDME